MRNSFWQNNGHHQKNVLSFLASPSGFHGSPIYHLETTTRGSNSYLGGENQTLIFLWQIESFLKEKLGVYRKLKPAKVKKGEKTSYGLFDFEGYALRGHKVFCFNGRISKQQCLFLHRNVKQINMVDSSLHILFYF